MSRTSERAEPSPTRSRRALPALVLAAIACGIVLFALTTRLQDGSRVDLTVENRTAWPVTVEVVTSGGALRTIGTIRPDTTRALREVLVPGDTWDLRWSVDGRELHRSSITHDSLRAEGFVLAVPEEVASAAMAAGLRPQR